MHDDVIETLRTAQRFGFFGPNPIEQAARHSLAYLEALGELSGAHRLIDLGTGGGLPGLVLADAYRSTDIVFLDRRQKRTDFLERAVHRLGFEHVTVICSDVSEVIRQVQSGELAPFDVVTARGFGPPDFTLRSASALMTPGGRVAISEPPDRDRWPSQLLAELGLQSELHGAVRVFGRLE
jgi:16S rRNA (guanine527-N7)-methyltransferase